MAKSTMNDNKAIDLCAKNIISERYKFYQCCQKSEETFYTFLQNIRNLADSCNFHGDEKELLIRDRFVCGICDLDLKSEIINNGGNPSIREVLQICDEQCIRISIQSVDESDGISIQSADEPDVIRDEASVDVEVVCTEESITRTDEKEVNIDQTYDDMNENSNEGNNKTNNMGFYRVELIMLNFFFKILN